MGTKYLKRLKKDGSQLLTLATKKPLFNSVKISAECTLEAETDRDQKASSAPPKSSIDAPNTYLPLRFCWVNKSSAKCAEMAASSVETSRWNVNQSVRIIWFLWQPVRHELVPVIRPDIVSKLDNFPLRLRNCQIERHHCIKRRKSTVQIQSGVDTNRSAVVDSGQTIFQGKWRHCRGGEVLPINAALRKWVCVVRCDSEDRWLINFPWLLSTSAEPLKAQTRRLCWHSGKTRSMTRSI